MRLSLSLLLLICISQTGCSSETKKNDAAGPRITGGAPVDNTVKPEKPAVGGTIKNSDQ